MGYIYEGMYRAKETIKSVFKGKTTDYSPYWKIIDPRWDRQLHRALNTVGCFLNPSLFYSDPATYGMYEVYKGFLDCMETRITDESQHDEIFKQVRRYKEGTSSFGRKLALRQRTLMMPRKFGHVYHNLQSRVTKTLIHAFLDPNKVMTQHYGAVQGLAALGPSVVRQLILPNLKPYLQHLEPEMALETHKNELKRHEAWRVYGALLHAAGQCMYDRLKLFPSSLSPPARSVWRTNGRLLTTGKRRASMDHLSQQPPLKKPAMDGSLAPLPANSLPAETDTFPAASAESDAGPSSSSGQLSNESASRNGRRDKSDGRVPKSSSILAQAWKEDVDTGHLFASLVELFGEGMLSFIQPPEMSFFV